MHSNKNRNMECKDKPQMIFKMAKDLNNSTKGYPKSQ